MKPGITSKPQQLTQVYAYAIQAVYTGTTISGGLSLQASVDYKQDSQGNVLFEGNWDTITGTPQLLTGPGVGIWNYGFGGCGYPWVRVFYSDSGSSNDATLTVTGYLRGV